MSWLAAAVIAGTVYQTRQAKKAQEQARKDQLEDQRQARRSEIFAETEGEGMGQLGKISLEVDDELEENEAVSSNLKV